MQYYGNLNIHSDKNDIENFVMFKDETKGSGVTN
jgi:hypothetical protein